MKKKIVIATRNQDKLLEYQLMLESFDYEVFSMFDFDIESPIETGDTFVENALIKAQTMRKITSELIMADDSGLEVFSLNMKPGIQSKRLSNLATDKDNNLKLLDLMENVSDRRARFVTSIVLLLRDGSYHVFEGQLHGYIHTIIEGDEGFGYDPVFIPIGYTETLAVLGQGIKTKISHRARAFKQLTSFLTQEM